MMKFPSVLLAASLAVSILSAGTEAASANKVGRYWTDAQGILDNVLEYQALWVRFHNCVWSECAVDDNDDDGEGRDGDENWYQNRVQEFCANAAYSLYGIPKNWISAPLMGCTQGHYIDSFFTYNSSDVFLRALGDTTTNTLYDDDNVVWGVGKGGAACHVNGDGSSSCLGCTAAGKFGKATFGDEYCDGNYFYGIEDVEHSYNSRIQTRCKLVYGRNGWVSGSSSSIEELLSNSWSCDVDMYPNGCPDPYGKKKVRANALHAASKGWNPALAYNNSRFKRPVRITSWFFLVSGIFFFLFSYRLSNKDRIKKRGGGLRGMILVAREDYESYKRRREEERRERIQAEYDEDNKVAKGWRNRRRRKSKGREGETEEERRERKRKKKEKKKRRKSRSKSRGKSLEPEESQAQDPNDYNRYDDDYGLPEVA